MCAAPVAVAFAVAFAVAAFVVVVNVSVHVFVLLWALEVHVKRVFAKKRKLEEAKRSEKRLF